jgi:hypothetical protein
LKTTKSTSHYLGIDPGKSGGLVVLDGNRNVVKYTRMPKSNEAIWNWLKFHTSSVERAVIERVSGFIGRQHPGSRMFSFGESYGALSMALVALGIPHRAVYPRTWQAAFTTPRTKTESRNEWKRRLLRISKKIFPQYKITLATADAFLIALYCLREGFTKE